MNEILSTCVVPSSICRLKKAWRYEGNCPNKAMINQWNRRGWSAPRRWRVNAFHTFREKLKEELFAVMNGLAVALTRCGKTKLFSRLELFLLQSELFSPNLSHHSNLKNDKFCSAWAPNIIKSLTHFPSRFLRSNFCAISLTIKMENHVNHTANWRE